jgi:hypothetical protein
VIAATWLLACSPPVGALASEDSRTRWDALDGLSAAQAGQIVPQLEKWAVLGHEGRAEVADEALDALVRADTDASLAAVGRLARSTRGSAAVAALAREAGDPRSCALAADLCAGGDRLFPADTACPAFEERRTTDPSACSGSAWPSVAARARPPTDLRAGDPELRRRALVWMDRDTLRARFDEVESIARTDPDPAVRAEAIRSLGYSRDRRALPLLDGWIGTEWGAAAAHGLLAYGGVEGCARVERLAGFRGPRARGGPIVAPAADPDGRRARNARLWLLTRPCPD